MQKLTAQGQRKDITGGLSKWAPVSPHPQGSNCYGRGVETVGAGGRGDLEDSALDMAGAALRNPQPLWRLHKAKPGCSLSSLGGGAPKAFRERKNSFSLGVQPLAS